MANHPAGERAAEEHATSLDVLEADAREFGDVGVVRARLRWDARMGDRDLSGDYVCADVFRREADRWRVVWRVSTKVFDE